MSRSHARIQVTIWNDPDFRALSVEAQRMYLLLLSQGSLNNAGVLPLTAKRWAAGCNATSAAQIEKVLAELDAARFVVADHDTEEVLIRSFIRNDGIVKQPQMMKNALREALTLDSPRGRAVLAAELRKLGREDAAFTADQIDPGCSPEPDPGGRSPIQAQGSLLEGFENPAELRRGGVGLGGSVTSRSTQVSARASRGTRIPEDFTVTQAMVVWARNECPDVDGRYATAQFIDYWTAKAGKDAVKVDWVRTWQTWMRKEQREAGRHPRLRAVPQLLMPSDPGDAFTDLRHRGAAQEAANLIGVTWREPSKPPSDRTPTAEWMHARRVEFIDQHADRIHAALQARKEAG